MSRVEWTRLEGNDVEAVVAMFINREQPTSTRINPSIGDGGVDILDRGVGEGGSDVVYQVKRHAAPLSAGAKTEVEKGLKRLMGPRAAKDKIKRDVRWLNLDVRTWNLVTPWDPTPEAVAWLHGLGETYGVKAAWKGLTYVEQLAAKYPDVVDYYLHGGRARIEGLYKELVALLSNDEGDLNVPSVNDRVQMALSTLSHDPHYRYEHRFGEGSVPLLGDRPGLVMSLVTAGQKSSRWTIVDVIARCAASTDERPITVSGTVHLPAGSDARDAFRDFLAFGTPFTSPAGAASGVLDAPGGLGRTFTGASFVIGAAADLGANAELHYEIVDPDGLVVAARDLNRTQRSEGNRGWRVVLEDSAGVFTFEDRYDLKGGNASRSLRFNDLAGKPVRTVGDALRFVSQCRQPNQGRVSIRFTPPDRGVIDPGIGLLADDEDRSHVMLMLKVVELLERIQTHTSSVVVMPDLERFEDQVRDWRLADAILSGRVVTGTYAEGKGIVVEVPDDTEIGDGDVVVALPFEVSVGNQKITLGRIHAALRGVTDVTRHESQGRTWYALQTSEKRVQYSLAPPSEAATTETLPD